MSWPVSFHLLVLVVDSLIIGSKLEKGGRAIDRQVYLPSCDTLRVRATGVSAKHVTPVELCELMSLCHDCVDSPQFEQSVSTYSRRGDAKSVLLCTRCHGRHCC